MNKRSINAFLISLVLLGMVFYQLTIPLMWNLNKTIGWGFGFEEYYALTVFLFLIFSFYKTIKCLQKDGKNTFSILALVANLIAILLFAWVPVFYLSIFFS